jgi:hypothetical protein
MPFSELIVQRQADKVESNRITIRATGITQSRRHGAADERGIVNPTLLILLLRRTVTFAIKFSVSR